MLTVWAAKASCATDCNDCLWHCLFFFQAKFSNHLLKDDMFEFSRSSKLLINFTKLNLVVFFSRVGKSYFKFVSWQILISFLEFKVRPPGVIRRSLRSAETIKTSASSINASLEDLQCFRNFAVCLQQKTWCGLFFI